MRLHLTYLAVPALILLAGCDQSMMMGGGQVPGDAGVVGSGTNTNVGAINADTAAASPQGIVAAQLATPNHASDCERLALTIQQSDSTEVERQHAIEEQQRIGCPV